MATITATVRENLIGIYMGMFKTAPGANAVSEMVVMWEAGKNQKQIAAELAKKPGFTAEYPELQLPIEFADEVVAWLASEATPAGKTWATNWIIGKVNAGISKSDIIVEAVLALRVATNTTDFGLAKDNLNNKIEVGVYHAVVNDQKADSTDVIAEVTSDAATVDAAKDEIDGVSNIGKTFTLTTASDVGAAFVGTSSNDVYTSNVSVVIDPSNGNQSNVDTMQAVDNLDGGAGTDTLNFTTKGGTVTLPALTSIEVINGESLAGITINTSTISGLTNLNINKAAGAVVATASSSTDVSAALTEDGAGALLANTVNGGNNVTVTATKQGTAAGANADTITIGGTTAAAGDVAVSSTGAAYTATTAASTLGAIAVTGGKSISVTQVASADTAAAAADTANVTITQGAVTVAGDANTTSVTVNQSSTATATNATFKTGGVRESASVKFGVLKSGDVLTVAGLTLTASADMTANEVAAAFANIVNNAAVAAPASIAAGDPNSGAIAGKGIYTGGATGWTSGAAAADTVVFSSTTNNSNVGDLTPALTNTSGNSVAAIVTTTQGKAHDAGASGGVMGVAGGVVGITDANATIKTISLSGYGNGSSTTTTTVLETLNITSVANGVGLTVADTAATLALSLDKVGSAIFGDATLTFTAAPTTLNVTSTGGNYVGLTAAATTDLNVSGTGVLDADSVDGLGSLAKLVVTGAAGAKLNAGVADTVTSVDTTGATGATTITIEGARATYAGGAGKDSVTLATDTALTKAISLGAGDDTLSFAALNVTGSTAAVSGGDGTDTLAMAVATAANLDAVKQTFYTGFERLTLNNKVDLAAADVTLDLENLGFTSYVTTSGTDDSVAGANKLILSNMATGGTLVLTGTMDNNSGGIQVNIKDAATGTADALNLSVSTNANLNVGTVTAAEVETINISAVDTVLPPAFGAVVDTVTMTVTADKATAVNLGSSSAHVALTLTGSTKVTSVDGSSMTGNLTVTSVNTTSASTLKGGAGADVLTAATGSTADVLIGGAGNDLLVGNAGLTTMTGGDGSDVFRIATPSLNVNSYATITDFGAGDLIQMAGIATFASAKVTLGDTAVFQDFANAAINSLAATGAGWFQFGGNTYVVADLGVNGATFTENEDFIVKLTGLVDLTNASFNNASDTISL